MKLHPFSHQYECCAYSFKVSDIICRFYFEGLLLQSPGFPQWLPSSGVYNIINVLLFKDHQILCMKKDILEEITVSVQTDRYDAWMATCY